MYARAIYIIHSDANELNLICLNWINKTVINNDDDNQDITLSYTASVADNIQHFTDII